MRRRPRRAGIVRALLCVALLAGSALTPAASAQEVESIFGMRVGEERAYILEPADHNLEGTPNLHVIVLDSIFEHGDFGRVARFRLAHQGVSIPWVVSNLRFSRPMFEQAEILVNEHGFPLEVDYQMSGALEVGPGVHGVSLRFEEGVYKVENPTGMRRREYELPLPDRDEIDTELLRGVFLHPDWHPALLTIPFTVLARGTDDIRFTALDPRALVGQSNSGPQTGSDRRNEDYLLELDEFSRRTIEFRGFEEVGIGAMTRQAHRVEVSGSRDRWIEPSGLVLRVDTRTRRGDAWIRLRWAAER